LALGIWDWLALGIWDLGFEFDLALPVHKSPAVHFYWPENVVLRLESRHAVFEICSA
jgi:hypothetical protein